MQNVGFDGHRIAGVFDTDSLTVVPEAVVVGHAAAIFSADWATDDPDPLPSLAEMQAFVEDGSVSDDQLSASTIPSGVRPRFRRRARQEFRSPQWRRAGTAGQHPRPGTDWALMASAPDGSHPHLAGQES